MTQTAPFSPRPGARARLRDHRRRRPLSRELFHGVENVREHGRPARRWSTLGVLECMRLPGPAARMTTFIRIVWNTREGDVTALSR